MIRSMTAFGSARAESEHGSVTIEFRTVNSRFLDVGFRLPDDLRFTESLIREQLNQAITRGKVDVRANYLLAQASTDTQIDLAYVALMAAQLQVVRRMIPDVSAPTMRDLMAGPASGERTGFDPDIWLPLCQQACKQALIELQTAREREGHRLAAMMLDCALEVEGIVEGVEKELPTLLNEHKDKISVRLREALASVSPDGFAQISGAELSARIAQETSLFSLRIDVAEELSRLRSHLAELQHILGGAETTSDTTGKASKSASPSKARKGSAGKRLDFLFQEMNREANTLGSKAAGLSVTRAAIDLKLLIEQMREQAQNIE